MTREEAKKWSRLAVTFESHIDKIYDDLETKVCGNCVSRTEEGGCEIYESLKPDLKWYCADFERKTT